MAKKFEPKVNESAKFVTRIANGQQASISTAVKGSKPRGGIVSDEAAKNYIADHFANVEKLFDIPNDLRNDVFEEVVKFGKAKIAADGFEKMVPSAEKTARKKFAGEVESANDEKNNEGATENKPEETTPADATPADTNPEPTAPANDEKKDGDGKGDVTNKPEEKNDDSDTETNAKDTKKPKKSSAWKTIAGMAACLVFGFLIAFAIFFDGTNDTPASMAHGSDANMAVYSCSEYLLGDYGAKGTITVCRDVDKEVGHKVTLLMDSTIHTDENGTQWLKYTSTTPDANIEIIAPVFPEGDFSATKDWQKNVDKRNRQFGTVELMWNGDSCVVTFRNVSRTYYLDLLS